MLTIAGKNISEFSLFVEGVDVCLTYASNELKLYLQRAWGIFLDVTKTKGDSQIRLQTGYQGKKDGFCIREENGNLLLIGENPRGTLYAVYHFLEKYVGWRFFAAKMRYHGQESGKYMQAVESLLKPECDCIETGHKEEENPVILFRDMYGHACVDEVWCAKNRINGDLWKQRNTPDYLGGTEVFASEGGHSFYELLPPDRYFNEHPEYYTYYNGEWQASRYLQICLTNENVVKEVAKNTIEFLRRNPSADYVSVSQNDGNIFCQCETCKKAEKKMGRGNVLLSFVNQVADFVKEVFPNKIIHTYAYESTLQKNLIPVRDNVMIQYCPRYCHGHTLNDRSCKINEITYDYLEHFSKICGNLFIYDYRSCDSSVFQPLPDLFRFRENMKVLADMNVKGLYSETSIHCLNTPCMEELRCYVTAKLMWNPYMTEEEFNRHIDEFLQGYYGKGWQFMRRYLELWDTKVKDIHFDGMTGVVTDNNGTPYKKKNGKYLSCSFLPENERDEIIAEMDRLLDAAIELANGEQAPRIDIVKAAVLWQRLFHTMEDILENGTEEEKKKVVAENQLLCTKMRKYCIKYTVFIGMNETTKMFSDFTLPPSKWTVGWKGRTDEPSPRFIFEDIILDSYGKEEIKL